ncbi:hypothetical protein EJB05_17639, partial [Eragrostis curvula]
MADLGGGAEAHARSNQYGYSANSSLVVTTESRPGDTHGPTGEPVTLRGRIDPGSFGDRAIRNKPTHLEVANSRRKRSGSVDLSSRDAKHRRGAPSNQDASVLSLTDDDVVYKPQMKETRAAYEALLGIIQQHLGGQPQGVLGGAADEVLATLKNDRIKNPDKKKEIEKLISTISNQTFDQLVSIGKIITDFHGTGDSAGGAPSGDGMGTTLDDDVGVAIVFEESDEDEECDFDQVLDELDEDDVTELNGPGGMQIGSELDDDDMRDSNQGLTVNVQDIDAYWLQRKITQAYGDMDHQQNQKLAEEILKIIAEGDDRNLENRLLVLLDHEKFDLIRLLLRNRLTIVWCTRLARAEGQEQHRKIEEDMRCDPSLTLLLEQLHATRASAKERQKNLEKNIRDEAKRLLRQKQLLDLDSLSFHQGGLLMANKECKLPQGSFRVLHKGYEEVHVPALKAKPYETGEKIVKIPDMPEWAQPAFVGMTQLNRVQSRVYDTALFKPDNILLCAPTGAGKTNVAVLTILQQIGMHMKDGEFDNSKYKIVYVSPMKALVTEIVGNLSKRLAGYNVTVGELSGDRNLTKQQMDKTQIIVTTPEKWDIVTRKSGERIYTQMVKLLIIDEIHLLHDNRGPVLESIVARTVRYRPCPLTQQYIGITARKSLQRFQLMNKICYEKVMAFAGKHQVLIFVHSRKETVKTACAIKDAALANDTLSRFLKNESASQEILSTHADLVKSCELKELLPYGFAIHHAGLARVDRELVEGLFADKHIKVLVSTATLAWGVNLPAHTVIIKGTQIYNPEKSDWTELSPLDVMQMLGRAGRPQYDTHGEGIILTGHSELQYYPSLMNQQLPIESQFISKLADQLNAEVVLGTIQNAREACSWLGYTYLYIRMLHNPTLYSLPADILESDNMLEKQRADLIHTAANILDRNGLIKYDRKTGQDEKMELVKILDRVPIPVKESLEESSAKINVLLQAYISRLKLEGLSLSSEWSTLNSYAFFLFVLQSAGRLLRALFEIVLKRGWAQLAKKALNLCKMVDKQMWSVQTPLRQFCGIPKEILMKLEKKELAWESYYDLSSQEIGELVRFSKIVLSVKLTITPDFQWDDKVHGYVEAFWVTVEDNDGENILHHEYFMLKKHYVDEDHTLTFTVPIYEPLPLHDDNVLVAAPVGSGKTTCAEFAILRNHQKAVSGEIAADLKLLDKGEIIISTPEKWDALSCRWKQRKQVQQVTLFIVDELHLLGSEIGHVLEIIVSRMRRISSHVGSNIRIIALSASLANAKDLDEWIGATSHGLFNFSPAVRPVPLDIYIQGVDIANFEARMQAMTKPTYTAITQHAKSGKPALVFVPTRKHARLTALDLCAYSSAESGGTPFLLGTEDEMDNFTRGIKEATLKDTLKCGVGYLHDGLSELDQELVTQMFLGGRTQVCVTTSSTMCWGRSLPAHLVVVMGTQYYDGRHNAHTNYPVSKLLQMIGHASRPLQDNSGKCVILCHAPRKEYYKKFIFEAFPVESHLHHFLHDHMNAEVAVGVIENKQDAVDYLTWTFMYRRLTKNPNYYNLQGVSHRHISDHLSQLIETVLNDLESSKCVAIEEEDMYLKPLNLGLIASYHYISYTTIERFSSMLTHKTKMKSLLEILASASEYAELPTRPCEEEFIENLVRHQRFSIEKPRYDDPHVKANALLQAHFSRHTVVGSLAADQWEILLSAHRLLPAMVDVISSNGWLSLALNAMELTQMVTQGMWDRDSVLLQLPHFTKDLAWRCKKNETKPIKGIFDLAELSFDEVTLERDMTNLPFEAGPVHSPRFPKPKVEGWWLVIGDSFTNQLLAIKRVALQRRSTVKLGFTAPAEVGGKDYMIYLMSDSYLGCDQEYEFTINVKDARGN